MEELKIGDLDQLQSLFAEGTAESEASFLSSIFVAPEDFDYISNLKSGTPRLLIGKKGTGKSALVRELVKKWTIESKPALLLKPKDIPLGADSNASLGELTAAAEGLLIKAIAAKVGELANGILDPELALLDAEAQREGTKRPDFVQKLRGLLNPIAAMFSLDLPSDTGVAHANKARFKAAVARLLQVSGTTMLIALDDTDQIARGGGAAELDRIWALILACRSIQEECPNIVAIIVLRSEVWRRLASEGTAHRDQVDHFRNSIYELSPGVDDVRTILIERFKAAAENARGPKAPPAESIFFAEKDVVIPTSVERRTWMDFIVGRSRKRPRDSIQMVALLAEQARRRRKEDKSKINSIDASKIIERYSEERIDDLQVEFGVECQKLKEVLRDFAWAEFDEDSFTFTADKAKRFITSILNNKQVILEGQVLRSSNNDHVFSLWRLLYQSGFLNARVRDESRPGGYAHIQEESNAEFASSNRWNEMQGAYWEVNPAYRDYLLKVQKDSPIGKRLPPKREKRRVDPRSGRR
ncbi:hypothetical protein E4A48_15975 [Xanthomonas cerealis pv. cerealis]|uniref:Uncharacterized protein n=1 Tax=Xanthomonas cerealis pv. cerealis TaxID=152263 RepID=A0A514EG33_9XANT|nr:hypothetical protein [Xanthomonas translucens]QDI04982.1 hypothetical protein E4A48_15975 [Xanthomonas translucens pv. cerealis]